VHSAPAKCGAAGAGGEIQRKLETKPPQTSAQPSTMTKSSSLQGNEMIGGLSMNMPKPIKIDATAKSIATKGK
jgi:hypothetical protein